MWTNNSLDNFRNLMYTMARSSGSLDHMLSVRHRRKWCPDNGSLGSQLWYISICIDINMNINVDYTIKDDMNINNNNNKDINIINDIFIDKRSSRTWNSVGRLHLSSWGAPPPEGSLRVKFFGENNHQWSFKRQSKCASRICVRSPGWSRGWNRNSNVDSVDRP